MIKRPLVKKVIITCLFAGIGLYGSAQTQSGPIQKSKYNENKIVEDDIGYTHAIKVDNILYISGTYATGDMPTQLKEIMESIKRTLAKYGATFQNVVKETVYTTDLDELIKNKTIHNDYYNKDFPTATWVEVKRLYLPQFKVEIEITAHLNKPE